MEQTMTCEALKTYDLKVQPDGTLTKRFVTRAECTTEIEKRVRTYMAQHDSADYEKALLAVLGADADLKQAYAES